MVARRRATRSSVGSSCGRARSSRRGGACSGHRPPGRWLRAEVANSWAKPRLASCHAAAALQQQLTLKPRRPAQAGRSELRRGHQGCAAAAEKSVAGACGAASEPPEPPSGPTAAEQRARAVKAPLPQAARQCRGGACSRRHPPGLRLRAETTASWANPRLASCRAAVEKRCRGMTSSSARCVVAGVGEPRARRESPASASASTAEPNRKPPQSSRAALAPAESRAPEEPTSSSACCVVARVCESRRAEQEAAAVSTAIWRSSSR